LIIGPRNLAIEPKKSSNSVLEMMRTKVAEYQSEAKMSSRGYVRATFDLLDQKLKAGGNYETLAGLMTCPDFQIKAGTLKTMMSKMSDGSARYANCREIP
jgi:hypothetical protein